MTTKRLLTVGCALALTIALALPAGAMAGNPAKASAESTTSSDDSSLAGLDAWIATITTASCGYPTSEVFAAWGDPALYYLVPGGNAEPKKHGWTLTGTASVVSGVSLLGGKKSFALDTGGQATSPAFCLTLDSPTLRFVVDDPGKSSAALRIDAVTACPWGGICTTKIATVQSGTKGLRLVPPVLLLANLGALLSKDGLTSMQLRFTAESGSWRVDDVYVDPFRRV